MLGIHFFAVIQGCLPSDESTISAKNLNHLKDKYSVETLNYFYETVFHEDGNGKRNIITKWNSNPAIAILGHATEVEIGYVERAISEISELNLPIKCSLAKTSDSASIKLFFGALKEVHAFLKLDSVSISDNDSDEHFGMGRSTAYDGIIEHANVGIYCTEKDLTHSTRYKVVLEEILQSLGIVGDSYNYPSSLFFQNYNPAKSLTPLDVNVLSLLYEPVIHANYTRESFEKDFADELYAVNTHQKIKNLLEKYPQTSYEDVEKCFFEGVFLKHPKETNLYMYGPIKKEDSLTIAHAISALNKLSPNINLKLAEPPAIEPSHGIILDFRQSDHQKESIKGSNEIIAGRTCMFPKLIKNKVLLAFNTSESAQALRQRSITDAIYFSLIQMPQEPSRTNELFRVKGSGIAFTPRYANLLKLVYSNEFIDGLKLIDFKEIKLNMGK
ncbi:hypothetical protein GCM10007415_25740 [Parapedobacter pyrenivorans]|uniref:Uncharacterized protein n=1 Tax=Parapedobacter pyrenivorans TaxID=1305674 RepID=A0A917MDD4_9SPHI|nr:DUF2927 domain-containing protein [Parapedobacter pyrenivorans]GGG90177.1 hypothetical protein GCM10007415_25740 [Parapedobacter pyrenivorans]